MHPGLVFVLGAAFGALTALVVDNLILLRSSRAFVKELREKEVAQGARSRPFPPQG